MPRRRLSLAAAAAALCCCALLAAGAAAQPGFATLADLPPSASQSLSSVKGCGGAALTPNLNDCWVEDDARPGSILEYTFDVPERGDDPFSVLLTLKSYGGLVEVFLISPRGAIYQYRLVFHLAGGQSGGTAMAEMFARVHGAELAPGTWRARVRFVVRCVLFCVL
jgi:hypothetical protein